MDTALLIACADDRQTAALCSTLNYSAASIIARAARLQNLTHDVRLHQPDVLMLEQSASALRDFAWLHEASPSTRLLMLCRSCEAAHLLAFVRAGARGCVLLGSETALLAKAVKAVHSDQIWFSRSELLDALRQRMVTVCADKALTEREEEIFDLVGQALSNKEIARQLCISDKTVKTHLHHIYVKLNKSGRYKAFLSRPDGLGGVGAVH